MKDFSITRNLDEGIYNVDEVFTGLNDAECLYEIYGNSRSLQAVLGKVRIKIVNENYYMYVDDSDGCIVIGKEHLRKSDERTLYLDIVHELVHVKQFMDGRDIYDERYDYVDRETEIEAYQVVVDEARKLGMDDDDIMEYLKVEWVSDDGLKRLATKLGVSTV